MNKINKLTYRVPAMDCPAEESLIRAVVKQHKETIIRISFDLPNRQVTVVSSLDAVGCQEIISSSGFKAYYIGTEQPTEADLVPEQSDDESRQCRVLWIVLLINASFFVGELVFGWISRSMGLTADSLDMLADAFVYGLSLMVVGHHIRRQKRVALASGLLQMILALAGFYEVIRRFIRFDAEPNPSIMIIVSAFALVANVVCLIILRRADQPRPQVKSESISSSSTCCCSGESSGCACSQEELSSLDPNEDKSSPDANPHLKASIIFSANDVIVNAGVIVSGILVSVFSTRYPDLIVGGLVFVLVFCGAIRIIRLAM